MTRKLDLTGRKFGRLTVIAEDLAHYPGQTRWRCQCDCGRQTSVRACALNNPDDKTATRSCGCARYVDLEGKTFGRLTVLRKAPSRFGTCWTCRCECGSETVVRGIQLYKNKTTHCGCVTKERTLKTIPYTQTDAAYAAGFFDGEGCVMIWRSTGGQVDTAGRRHHRLVISVSQTHIGPLEWLMKRFGGTISFTKTTPDRPNFKDKWTWVLSNKRAAEFLRIIQPYLVLKAERVVIALKFQDTMMSPVSVGKRGWSKITPEKWDERETFRNEMMRLNKRGIA